MRLRIIKNIQFVVAPDKDLNLFGSLCIPCRFFSGYFGAVLDGCFATAMDFGADLVSLARMPFAGEDHCFGLSCVEP